MVLAFYIWSDYHRYPNHSSLHLHAKILRRRCNRRSGQIETNMHIKNFRQFKSEVFIFLFILDCLIAVDTKVDTKNESGIISRLILYLFNYNLRLCDGACWFPKRQLHQVPYQKLLGVLLLNQYLAE